jgi:hypothetical protein
MLLKEGQKGFQEQEEDARSYLEKKRLYWSVKQKH